MLDGTYSTALLLVPLASSHICAAVSRSSTHHLIASFQWKKKKKRCGERRCSLVVISELHSDEKDGCSICLWFLSSFPHSLCAQDLHNILFTEHWGCTVRFSEKTTRIGLEDASLLFFTFLFVWFFRGGGQPKAIRGLQTPTKTCPPTAVLLSALSGIW